MELFSKMPIFANLTNANFEKSHLFRANLKRADLTYANLEDAYLLKIRNLEIEQLKGGKTLFGAKMEKKLRDQVYKEFPQLFQFNSITEPSRAASQIIPLLFFFSSSRLFLSILSMVLSS